jgi:hypothetical protein
VQPYRQHTAPLQRSDFVPQEILPSTFRSEAPPGRIQLRGTPATGAPRNYLGTRL